MREAKDLIGLLVTIDLGVLAAALTLLALYPAIAGFAHKTGIKVVLGTELKRRMLFLWLGRAAALSGLGLTLLLCQAVWGVLIDSQSATSASAASGASGRYEQALLWITAALTTTSVLAGARAGRLIFTMTLDAA